MSATRTLEKRQPDAGSIAPVESDAAESDGVGPTRVVQRGANRASAPPPRKRSSRSRTRSLIKIARSLAAAALAVGAGALAATVWRSTVSAKPTPSETVVGLEATSRAGASMTRLSVVTTPSDAHVLVDGVKLSPATPHEAPRDGAYHRVQVEAPGHVSQTVMVQFDREAVPLRITLEPEPLSASKALEPAPQPDRAPARPSRADRKSQAPKSGAWVRDVGLDSPDPWQK
jgi:hypothetical protein